MKDQVFMVGRYVRLSKEDGDNKQSESIDNQLLIIQQYLDRHPELVLVDTYIDDGYTGMNYDRDDFIRMMRDVETGKINTIITKDLSRLGRDQVETSRLLRKDFIIRKIRYIAVDDNIDTFSEERNDIEIPFRILVNDFYSKDISVKVKASLNSKREHGEFIGAFAPYGYKKDEKDNNKLIPDEEAAQVVKRIFRMFLQGYGKMKIARILNKEGIPGPTAYKHRNKENYHNSKKLESTSYWTYSTVYKILCNEVYIGHMVQHKQEKISYNLKQNRSVPREKHIVVQNMHAPIIDEDIFKSVQKLLSTKNRNPGMDENVTMYAGILKCGDCGRRLCKTMCKTRAGRSVYYKCGTYKQYGKDYCSGHTIREEILNSIVLNAIRQEAKIALKQKDIDILKQMAYNTPKGSEELKIKEIKNAILALQKEKSNMLRMLAKGIISEEDYLSYQNEISEEEKKYKELENSWLDKKVRKKSYLEQYENWVMRFINYIDIEEITREVLIALVEEIKVFEDKRIEITFKFKNSFSGDT